jgi:hypothetical protein
VSTGDTLYALQVDDQHRASKAFRWREDGTLEKVATYDAGWRFRMARVPFDETSTLEGIEGLADALAPIEARNDLLVIRGTPRNPDRRTVNRQYREERNDTPHWQAPPEGRQWLMVDLDDLPAPDGLLDDTPDAGTLREAVRYATLQLPECFHGATTFYQWSSSAGLECVDGDVYRPGWDTLRLHLWYWCDRPVCGPSLREWFGTFRDDTGVPVDPKLYNPVQPHFVAAPEFCDGPDPLGARRSSLLQGDRQTVTLPDTVLSASEWREREQQQQQAREARRQRLESTPRRRSDAQVNHATTRYAEAALTDALETVRTAPAGGRHNTLSEQAFSMGTLVGAGVLKPTETFRLLVDAATSNGLPHSEAKRTARDGIDAGKAKPRDLTSVRRRDTSGHSTDTRSTAPGAADKADTADGSTSDDIPSLEEINAYLSGEHEQADALPSERQIVEQFEYRAGWLQYCDGRDREAAEREALRRLLQQADGPGETDRIRSVVGRQTTTDPATAAAE